MEKYYSLNETADILGVKVRTLREWLKDGTLIAHKYENKKKWYDRNGFHPCGWIYPI